MKITRRQLRKLINESLEGDHVLSIEEKVQKLDAEAAIEFEDHLENQMEKQVTRRELLFAAGSLVLSALVVDALNKAGIEEPSDEKSKRRLLELLKAKNEKTLENLIWDVTEYGYEDFAAVPGMPEPPEGLALRDYGEVRRRWMSSPRGVEMFSLYVQSKSHVHDENLDVIQEENPEIYKALTGDSTYKKLEDVTRKNIPHYLGFIKGLREIAKHRK